MTCRDIDDLMSSARENSVRTPSATAHLTECGDCRALMSVLHEAAGPVAPPETQLKRIQARILENLKPVRPLAPSLLFLFACAIIFICIVAIGAAPLEMHGWGALSTAQRIAVFATLAASAVLLAVSMVGQMVPGSKYAFAPAALPTTILAALLIVLATAFQPREEPAFVADGLVCMRSGFTYSIPAAFLFWLVVRRGAILYPKLVAATAGGLAGLAGLSVLELNCSNLNVFHVLLWHWGVVLISSFAGALLGAAVQYIGRRRSRNVS
jgi:hypothetical protein